MWAFLVGAVPGIVQLQVRERREVTSTRLAQDVLCLTMLTVDVLK